MNPLKLLATFATGVLFSAVSHAAEPYDGLPTRYIDFYTSGKMEDALLLASNQSTASQSTASQPVASSPPDARITAQARAMNEDLKEMGTFRFSERVMEHPLGTHWASVAYVVGFDKGPMLFTFQLYKPEGTWQLKDVHTSIYKKELNDLADKVAGPAH